MFLSYLTFPEFIKPEIIQGTPLRWYSMMYIFAFVTAWFLFSYQIKKINKKNIELGKENTFDMDMVSSYFVWAIFGLILGARIFSTLVYANDRLEYWAHPWLIFLPAEKIAGSWKFTGLAGMSYHGGVIGTIISTVIFCYRYRLNFWKISDLLAASIPLGYTFGRLGNFINQELYGRVTDSWIGMVFSPGNQEFPRIETFSTSKRWVLEMVEKLKLDTLPNGMYNLPRHPSQLYEAFFEGIILWFILWFFVRLIKRHNGQVLGSYLLGYGLFRFFIEYFRKPDAGLGPYRDGYIINFTGGRILADKFHPWNAISMGQILCFLMILAGVLLIILAPKLNEWNERALIKWGTRKALTKKEREELKEEKAKAKGKK